MSAILIVEDQREQIIFLQEIIYEVDNEAIIFTATNIKEAIDIATRETIEIFLIDIGLPDGSGLDLANKIRGISKYELSWIIFLTTYTQYMLKAFKRIHCYDYIIKPYKKSTVKALIEKLLNNLNSDDSKEYLTFKMRDYTFRISTDEIVFIEVYRKNCTIHTYNGEQYTVKKTPLSEIQSMLSSNFVQCHRSYVVNINYVKIVEKQSNSWEVSFTNHRAKITLGDKFRDNIFSKLIENEK